MKFSIDNSVFAKAFRNVSRIISNKADNLITTGLKLSADVKANRITLTGINSDLALVKNIPASDNNHLLVGESGSIVLPDRFANEAINNMPKGKSDRITISTGKRYITTIHSKGINFHINSLDADNFPHLPHVTRDHTVVIDGSIMKNLIKSTVFASAKASSHGILQGVNFNPHNSQLIATATDGYRLSRLVTGISTNRLANQVTIPRDSLKTLAQTIGRGHSVVVSFSQSQARFRINNDVIYTRLLSGAYPDVEGIMPNGSTRFNTVLKINSGELIQSLERASVISDTTNDNVVSLSLSPKKRSVVISAQSQEMGQTRESATPDDLTGTPLKISFQPNFMLDALKAIGKKSEADIYFMSPVKPFIIYNGSDNQHTLTQMLTPIRHAE